MQAQQAYDLAKSTVDALTLRAPDRRRGAAGRHVASSPAAPADLTGLLGGLSAGLPAARRPAGPHAGRGQHRRRRRAGQRRHRDPHRRRHLRARPGRRGRRDRRAAGASRASPPTSSWTPRPARRYTATVARSTCCPPPTPRRGGVPGAPGRWRRRRRRADAPARHERGGPAAGARGRRRGGGAGGGGVQRATAATRSGSAATGGKAQSGASRSACRARPGADRPTGCAEGERVVVRGADQVRAGQRAAVIDAAIEASTRTLRAGRRDRARAARGLADHRGRRLRGDRRPVRLRQVDADAPARRRWTGRPPAGCSSAGATSPTLSAAEMAQLRNETIGFVFQSFHLLRPHHGAGQRRAAAGLPRVWARASGGARAAAMLERVGPGAPPRPPAQPAVRRRAAAGRDRPGAGHRAGGAAGRRAHRQPRHRDRPAPCSTCSRSSTRERASRWSWSPTTARSPPAPGARSPCATG